jgi:hypothetical protein
VPSLTHLPATTPAADVAAILIKEGALILDDVLAPSEVDALVNEIGPYVEATGTGRDDFSGRSTTRTGALVARSPLVRSRVLDPIILALCDAVLLPYCQRYQLHLTQLIRLLPGQGAQAIHRDRWAWGPYLQAVQPQLNTIWALTEFTEENGATQVAPGSVDWPDKRRPESHELCQATMRRGSVLVYNGSVFHGGGANHSGEARWGLNLTYALGWLRQEENQYLSCPPEVARTLEPALQALVGYSMGNYALGYYTPPLGPGEGPDIAPPEYALGGGSGEGSSLGSESLLRQAAAAHRQQAVEA